VLDATNYQYVLLYTFRDDGQIGLRLGATGRNLYFAADDATTHSHVGCWRVNLDLDGQVETVVEKVKLDTAALRTGLDLLTREARFKWNPEQFTRLRVESTRVKNGHRPPHAIAYDLIPMASGAARYYNPGEAFTLNDFWVTLAKTAERRCADLAGYENREPLGGGEPVVWFLAAVNHTPRDEDYGLRRYDPSQGVAITTWTGFDLKPRNLFSSSPLYP
jgi:Cu2+-containing amine oxidase